MTEKSKDVSKLDQPFPWWFILLIPVYVMGALSLMLFPFAGDWRWLNGWLFLIPLALNITVGYAIINHKNPRVLRNRAKLKKTGLTNATRASASSDRFIYPLMAVGFFGAMILSAVGKRLGWYQLPLSIALVGVVTLNIGVAIMNIAQLHNAHASKILDINQGQVLVDTGLYAQVRHPLYAGAILMAMGIPIALGSLWGLLPAFLAALALVLRIQFEEAMLLKGMQGYADYMERVKYKLIPGIF